MSIIINLDVMMAKRKKGLTELAGQGGYYTGQSVYSEK